MSPHAALTPHPFAALLPRLSDLRYANLEADVLAHGLRDPITLYQDQILDGVHRHAICLAHGLELITRTFSGDDVAALAFVQSGIAGRQLSGGQLIVVALGFEEAAATLARATQKAAGAKGASHGVEGGRGKKKPLEADLPQGVSRPRAPQARDRAAAAAGGGLTGRTIQTAKRIKRERPDLYATIVAGTKTVDAANRQLKEDVQKAELAAPPPDHLPAGLHVGDFRAFAEHLPDASVALIFTDPPYDRDAIPLFHDLAEIAQRVLRPGGSLVAYCGQVQLPEVLAGMSKYLRYWWVNACLHSGPPNQMQKYGIKNHWKPIVWFVKETRGDVQAFVADVVTGAREKTHHAWQQAVSEAAYYVEHLCPPDGVVWDPFAGGGTTLIACEEVHRKWIACEINPVTAATIIERLESAS